MMGYFRGASRDEGSRLDVTQALDGSRTKLAAHLPLSTQPAPLSCLQRVSHFLWASPTHYFTYNEDCPRTVFLTFGGGFKDPLESLMKNVDPFPR